MSKHLFFDERAYLLDDSIVEADRIERETKLMYEIEREEKLKKRGIRIFRSNNRFRNRKGKKYIYFPHYPTEFLPF